MSRERGQEICEETLDYRVFQGLEMLQRPREGYSSPTPSPKARMVLNLVAEQTLTSLLSTARSVTSSPTNFQPHTRWIGKGMMFPASNAYQLFSGCSDSLMCGLKHST